MNEEEIGRAVLDSIDTIAAILSKKVDDGEIAEVEAKQILYEWCLRRAVKQ